MSEDEYSIGECTICGKNCALKYGLCPECANPKIDNDMPDMFKNIFGNAFNSNIKNNKPV